jgi:hypothetical protein
MSEEPGAGDTPAGEVPVSGLRLELGTPVRCQDGDWGQLRDLVIDPAHDRVTHLVVTPNHEAGQARMIPIELAGPGRTPRQILLGCTCDEAAAQPRVQDVASVRPGQLPEQDPGWEIGVRDVISAPELEPGAFNDYVPVDPYPSLMMTYDRVPEGMVEIRRESGVTTADGHTAGRIEGFLTDAGTITHIVLERGHLWGRREVTIPVSAIARVSTDDVTLTLTKDQVHALPAIRLRRS